MCVDFVKNVMFLLIKLYIMSTEKCQQTDKMLKVDEVALVDSFEGLELVVKQAESSCPSFQKMLQAHNIIG